MALGSQYNNNSGNSNNTGKYAFSMDSSYKFCNGDSKIDQTGIKFSFWNGLIKVTIASKLETSTDNEDYDKFDWKNGTTVYLSYMKAALLLSEIKAFREGKLTNAGVTTGRTSTNLIYISNGKEFGNDSTCIVIVGINENGGAESTAVYEFKKQFNYAVRNYDSKNISFEKQYYDDIELDSICTLLEQFYTAMSGAVAYSVINANGRNDYRVKCSLESIAAKLGVDLGYGKNNNNSTKPAASNFFNNSSKSDASFNNATLDDILQ